MPIFSKLPKAYQDQGEEPYPIGRPPMSQSPWWSAGEQAVPNPFGEQLFNVAVTAGTLYGLHYFGKREYAPGVTGYDLYLKAIRGIEEYSPGRVLRTFQFSHLLSPKETASRTARYFSPEMIAGMMERRDARGWIEYHSKLIGRDISLLEEGFRFEGGQLLAGRTGNEVLLRHAATVRNPIAADPKLLEAYGRSLKGGPWRLKEAFTARIPYISEAGEALSEPFAFIGGHTRWQATKRAVFGYGTSLVERFNQLARSPFEAPIVSDILRKLPYADRLKLSVTPSSGLKTLGKLAAKLGIALPAVAMGYGTLDWMVRNATTFDDTILSEGITAGLATVWTKGQMALSKGAEILGLHSLRERQEAIAPGSTELSKLLAFPIMGGLGGVGLGYAHRVYSQISQQATFGLAAHEASLAYQASQKFFLEKLGGQEVPEDFLRLLSPSIRAVAEEKAERLAASKWGKVARWLVDAKESESVVKRLVGGLYKKPTISRMLGWTGFIGGLAMVAPFIPGALVPNERPEELERIYSGEQEIPVRKGRWWEFGRSPWEGQRVDRFRPHWYPRMLARAREKSIYGEDLSPITQWWKENFTYDIEKQHYYDRPYPITSPAFQDVPIIGPILGATIGRLVKPPRIMHEEEWLGTTPGGEELTKRMPLGYGERLESPEMGEVSPGSPISPFEAKGVIGEQAYNLTELIGLPGFAMTSVKERITGSQDLFDQEMQLAAAGDIYSQTRQYWDLELGGLAGTTEFYRRLYPHERRQIEKYNPLRNTMPTWLPGPGDRSPDFLHGDPFAAIPEGELRLPGPGFAALHPELEGVNPEDYPDIWKLKILADIAPYSERYGQTLGRVRAAKNRGQLSDRETEMYNTILEQIKAKKTRKEFDEYLYRDRKMTPSEETLSRINEAFKEKGDVAPNIFERALGSYWQELGHAAETPLEYLTPVAPASKFLHMRTAIEDYEKTQLYGTTNAFWQHPIRDFIKPFMYSAAHAAGWEGIPSHERRRRDIESYFDVLKYVKFTRLKNMAESEGNADLVREYEAKRRETLFGVDPYTRNYTYVFRALPRRERDYFNAFVGADVEERQKIFGMIPENERALYAARWQMEDVTNWKKAIKTGELTSGEAEQAQAEIEKFYQQKQTEGFPVDNNLWEQYKATKQPRETYPDWYRRVKLLPKYLTGRDLPGPDWVGMDPRVSLEDVKLKVIQNLGESPFEYDIWPDDVRAAARRPYLEKAAEQLYDDQLDESEVRSQLQKLLSAHGITATSIMTRPIYGGQKPQIDLTIEDDRSADIQEIIKRQGLAN